jgi:hypothetical protein
MAVIPSESRDIEEPVMTRIIVGTDLESKLRDAMELVELCDKSGKVLGEFLPRVDPATPDREPRVSEEELDRREKSDKWYSTAEVLAHLEKL